MSESQPLSESEKRCRLRLARTQNIGPVTFRALINQFGNGTDALAALPELAAKGGRSRALKIFPKSKADAEWEAASAIGATLHFLGDTDYPKPLAALEDAPPIHLRTRPCHSVANASDRNGRLTQCIGQR